MRLDPAEGLGLVKEAQIQPRQLVPLLGSHLNPNPNTNPNPDLNPNGGQ